MKIINKFALATVAVCSLLSINALADDFRTVVCFNGHGSSSIIYRRCDSSPSVAVYAGGQSVGDFSVVNPDVSPRFKVKHNPHGSQRFEYRAE